MDDEHERERKKNTTACDEKDKEIKQNSRNSKTKVKTSKKHWRKETVVEMTETKKIIQIIRMG